MKIKMADGIPQKIENRIPSDWKEYDEANGIDSNYNHFSLIISDDNGNNFGYLTAYTVFAEIYINEMWINSKYRKKGLGRLLLSELEQRLEGKGYWNINLCTSEYQAPEFYKKCGFELEFIRIGIYSQKSPVSEINEIFFCEIFQKRNTNTGNIRSR
jgi:ribosomal protein S18 acetylase RimI-like enzyme